MCRRWLMFAMFLAVIAVALRAAAAGPLGMTGSDIVSPDVAALTLDTGLVPRSRRDLMKCTPRLRDLCRPPVDERDAMRVGACLGAMRVGRGAVA